MDEQGVAAKLQPLLYEPNPKHKPVPLPGRRMGQSVLGMPPGRLSSRQATCTARRGMQPMAPARTTRNNTTLNATHGTDIPSTGTRFPLCW